MLEPYELALMIAGASSKLGIEVFDAGLSQYISSRSLGPPNDKLVFVDAGSRSAHGGGGEASVVKLATLKFDPSTSGWSVLHPAIPPYNFPFAVFEGGENVRRGLTYLAEIASLLAWVGRGAGYAVRHGPLQQVHYYLRKGYDIDSQRLRAILHYAGLDRPTALDIMNEAELCKRGGSNTHNIGLALLAVLKRLSEENANKNVVVAGVVEDVSRSRAFIGGIVAEVVAKTWKSLRDASNDVLPTTLGRKLFDLAGEYYDKLLGESGYGSPNDLNSNCFCVSAAGSLVHNTGFEVFAGELLGKLRSYTQQEPDKAPRGLLSLAASSLLASYSDPMLILWLYYLGLGDNKYFTAAMPRLAAYEAAVEELQRRRDELVDCRAEEPPELAEPLKHIYFTYMVAEPAPSCISLLRRFSRQGGGLLRPCELSGLLKLPVPVRVELILSNSSYRRQDMDLLVYLYWAAVIVAYKYPAPLLVVDRFSRISPSEFGAAELLSKLLSRKRLPYNIFLHRWETRAEI